MVGNHRITTDHGIATGRWQQTGEDEDEGGEDCGGIMGRMTGDGDGRHDQQRVNSGDGKDGWQRWEGGGGSVEEMVVDREEKRAMLRKEATRWAEK